MYLDDVLIKSATIEEHAKHLDAVLTSLGDSNYFCQLPKCQFALPKLNYLGFVVDGEGVKPDPKKVDILSKWHPPLKALQELHEAQSSTQRKSARKALSQLVRRFIGFMTFFSRFIPRYAQIAYPLYQQMRDDPPPWSPDCEVAWETLRKLLSEHTMMYHPDFSLPFHVFTDASVYAIGGAILQKHKPPDGQEALFPVCFCARKMTDAEVKYITTEQEMLAIVYCFHQWRCYLQGTEVILHTDHEPLTWLQTQPRLSRRQARWMEFLSEFTYRPLHVPGEQNVVADALSRRLDLTAPDATCIQPVRADSIPAVNLISILPPNGFLGARIFLLRHSAPNAIFAIRKRPQLDANVPRKQTRQATRLQNEQRADPPRATATADTPTSTPCASLEPFQDDARPAEPDPPASGSPPRARRLARLGRRHATGGRSHHRRETFRRIIFPSAGIPSRRSRHQHATETIEPPPFGPQGLIVENGPGATRPALHPERQRSPYRYPILAPRCPLGGALWHRAHTRIASSDNFTGQT